MDEYFHPSFLLHKIPIWRVITKLRLRKKNWNRDGIMQFYAGRMTSGRERERERERWSDAWRKESLSSLSKPEKSARFSC